MADEGRRGGPDSGPAVDPSGPGRSRGAATDAQLTVDALLARSRGTTTAPGRRRADRRTAVAAPPSRPSSSAPRPSTTTPPPSARPGLPPPAPRAVPAPVEDAAVVPAVDADPVQRLPLPPAPPVAGTPAPSAVEAPTPTPEPATPPTTSAVPAPPATSELPASGIVQAPATSSVPAQTGGPRPVLPPVPDAGAVRSSAPVPVLPGTERARRASAAAAAQPGPVAVPADDRSPRPSAPVPPLPGTERAVRNSAPVPPLPGLRAAAPLPPIPGRDVPVPEAPRAPMSPLLRRLVRVAVVLGVLVGLVAGFYVGLYFYADRTIDRVAALSPQAPEVLAPQLQDTATTWLVLGADEGRVVPSLLRVAQDGGSAVLVDVPATALVDTPECRAADGEVRAPTTEDVSSSYLQGGPSCLVRAVQQVTGLRVDHLLSVDLGRLDAPASCPTDGLPVADLGMALNPVRATSVLVGAADALTVDEDTTLGDLRSLASTLDDLPAGAVERTELPVSRVGYVPAGGTRAQVLLDGVATRALVESLLSTGELPEPVQVPPAAEAAPTADAVVTVAPAGIPVQVLDASGSADPTSGPGATVATALAAQGFVVPAVAPEPAATPVSVVRYAPELVEQARTVAAAVPGAVLEPSAATGGGIQLVVAGPDLAVVPVAVGSAVPDTALPAVPPTATCG